LPSAKDAAASTSWSRPDPSKKTPTSPTKKFRGNPTKSFRSRDPLRITGEITDWQGHAPGAIQAMKDGLERRQQLGVED
jgi:rifampin ADP-ribosylating transferase